MRVLEYAKTLNANSEVIWWLEHTGRAVLKKDQASESDLEHIIDWMVSGDAPQRLKKMSLKDAVKKTDDWVKKNIERGSQIEEKESDLETFIDFGDGFKFMQLLTKNSFQREGSLMSHCLGGYNPASDLKIYSLRDSKNNPHCTIEVRGDKEVNQIKGKGNGSIHPKYINYVLDFLEKVGMKIRPNEMQNLGYHHVDEIHLDFIKQRGLEKELVKVRDNYYAV